MKKLLIVLVIAFLCIGFVSCRASEEPLGDKSAINNSMLERYLYIDLPQIQKKNQKLYYVEWGKLSETSIADMVYVLSEEQYIDSIQSVFYMIANIQGDLIVQELGTADKMVLQNGRLSLADIDGDSVDEIVFHSEVSGNGATFTRVYKVEGDSFKLLANLDEFNTGFSSVFEKNYKLRIVNKHTEYSKTLDISSIYSLDFFDKDGLAVEKASIFVKPFFACKVVEGVKGKFDLFCRQEVSLSGYIGIAETTLRYNSQKACFEVIKAEFIPNMS